MRTASLPTDRLLQVMGLVSLALILGALGLQYLGGVQPCEMCHWQRWPHIAAAILGLCGAALLKPQARGLAWIVVVLITASGLIGLYQTGMQIGWLPGPTACTVDHPYVLGSNVVPEVSCNRVTWSLLGLSLASYNAIISFLVAGSATLLLVRRG
jgi:disulfide bond formation protein DsbB